MSIKRFVDPARLVSLRDHGDGVWAVVMSDVPGKNAFGEPFG